MITQLASWMRAALVSPPRSLARDFALAAFLLLAALLARYALDAVLPKSLPYITFFPALILAAGLCSPAPAISFAVAAAFFGTMWIEVPAGYNNYYHSVAVFLFLLAASIVILLTFGLKDLYRQLEVRDQQLRLVNDELAHRIRNLFQVAIVIVSQSIRGTADNGDLEGTLAGRLQALSRAQSLITLNRPHVALSELVNISVVPLAPDNRRLFIAGPAVPVPSQAVTMLGLVLYELGTNALKYGAWSGQEGTVSVSWRRANGMISIAWEERDGPPVTMPERLGAGSKLIHGALQDAKVDYRLEQHGARCNIELNLT